MSRTDAPPARRTRTPWCWLAWRPLAVLGAGFVALVALGVLAGVVLAAATPGWQTDVGSQAGAVLGGDLSPQAEALAADGAFDEEAAVRVADARVDAWVPVASRIADLAKIWLVVPLVLAFGLGWWWRRGTLDGWFVPALAGGGALAMSVVVKYLTYRPRPPEELAAVEAFGPSFPSGHVLRAVTVYGAAAFLLAGIARRRGARIIVWGAALGISVAVGLARIYEAAHWPTDVLVSYALAAGWLAIVVAATTRWSARGAPVEAAEA